MPRRGWPGDQRVHRADGRLHRGAVVDDPRRRRRGARPGKAPPPPQLRDPPRRPGTRPRPVPVPGLRVPPDRPAPHPALGQRRPHRPGQPDQLVPLAPQGGPRPRLPHRRPTRRRRFAFYRPDGTPLPSSPPLPEPGGGISRTHDADITPDTIIPPWYGERLDLNHAIWACFANARTREEREARRRPRQPGPRHHLRTRGCARTLPPVPRTRPPGFRPHPDPRSGVTRPARRPVSVKVVSTG